MATWLDRLWRKASQRRGTLRDEAAAAPDAESIAAALAEAEELAVRTHALSRDLHRLLARGVARLREERGPGRILH